MSVPGLEEDYNSLWESADLAFEELKTEERLKNPIVKKENTCEHKFVCEDVCTQCGACLYFSSVCHEGEWNNYRDDTGNFSKNIPTAVDPL